MKIIIVIVRELVSPLLAQKEKTIPCLHLNGTFERIVKNRLEINSYNNKADEGFRCCLLSL